MEWLFVIGAVAIVAALCHLFIRSSVFASLLAALVSGTLFVLFFFTTTLVQLGGKLDETNWVAAKIIWSGGSLLAIPISLFVGVFFSSEGGAEKSADPGYCRCCGYNLAGNESGRCPECGTDIVIGEA